MVVLSCGVGWRPVGVRTVEMTRTRGEEASRSVTTGRQERWHVVKLAVRAMSVVN